MLHVFAGDDALGTEDAGEVQAQALQERGLSAACYDVKSESLALEFYEEFHSTRHLGGFRIFVELLALGLVDVINLLLRSVATVGALHEHVNGRETCATFVHKYFLVRKVKAKLLRHGFP